MRSAIRYPVSAGLPSALSLLLLQVRDHGLSEGFCDKSSVFTVQTLPILRSALIVGILVHSFVCFLTFVRG